MSVGLVFDGVLMLFLAGSGINKILGREKAPVAALGFNHNWVYLIGALQLAAIYFVFTKAFLLVLILVGVPYLLVATRTAVHKQMGATAALLIITAMIAARWLTFVAMP